jgi:hypothetical protein
VERPQAITTVAGQRLELEFDQRSRAAGSPSAFAVLVTDERDRIIGRVPGANVVVGQAVRDAGGAAGGSGGFTFYIPRRGSGAGAASLSSPRFHVLRDRCSQLRRTGGDVR